MSQYALDYLNTHYCQQDMKVTLVSPLPNANVSSGRSVNDQTSRSQQSPHSQQRRARHADPREQTNAPSVVPPAYFDAASFFLRLTLILSPLVHLLVTNSANGNPL